MAKRNQLFRGLIFLCFGSITVVLGQCTSGQYGGRCQYQCHCVQRQTCDIVPRCGGNCARGWDGPECQRQNVALGQRTEDFGQSGSLRYASVAVDGNTNQRYSRGSCTHAGRSDTARNLSWWRVTLDRQYNINRFVIYNRKDCCSWKLNGFILYVAQTSSSGSVGNYRLCYSDQTSGGVQSVGPGDSNGVIREQCTSPLTGDVVEIRQTRGYPLSLCEVIIYVCAPGWYGEDCDKECESTTGCLRCDSFQQQCEKCVTGKFDTDCTQDCYCFNGVPCNKTTGRCPDGKCAPGYNGDTCNTACVAGRYGLNCGMRCGYCSAGTTRCNFITGDCPIGGATTCQRGYQGPKCDQNCTLGRYGADCLGRCGNCAGESNNCDRFYGRCPDVTPRCDPGWEGASCDIGCSSGQYGADCGSTCGHCAAGKGKCDTRSGVCPQRTGQYRCDTGYVGEKCADCVEGTWGEGCKSNCSEYCAGGVKICDIFNGTCYSGCIDGYTGPRCEPAELSGGPGGKSDTGLIAGVLAEDRILLPKSGIIAGAIVIIVVFITLVVIIGILVRTVRQRRTDTPEDLSSQSNIEQRGPPPVSSEYEIPTQPVDGPSADQEHTYEDLKEFHQ